MNSPTPTRPDRGHAKRYQDVEDLLHAGIHVIGTMNIQHLESLYDEVERVTNVKVKERIPDRVLAEADRVSQRRRLSWRT